MADPKKEMEKEAKKTRDHANKADMSSSKALQDDALTGKTSVKEKNEEE
ncbi:hypothetical protein [Robiginitomaculum antarcticum]|nr:hypothetical protein [Robiginitomaculum antarcticum]